MNNFEHLVRPFQSEQNTPPQNVPTAQVVARRNVLVTPGIDGAVKTFSGAYSITITYYSIRIPRERTGGDADFNPNISASALYGQ